MDALAIPSLLVVLPFVICGAVMAVFIAGWLANDFVRRWVRGVW